MSDSAAEGRRGVPGLRHVCESVVYEHVFSNADREVGGVLVGRIAYDGARPTVTGAIPAIAADEQRAALTFTQDSWEHVHRVLDREFPHERIVGWYHSHPGFGIFLSGHDLFIHRNFFSGRSQIALVVDPVACEEGIFAWRSAKNDVDLYMQGPTPAGWYALAKDGSALPARPGRQPPTTETGSTRRLYIPPLFVLVALVAFAAAFAISFLALRRHSPPKSTPTVTVVTVTTATGSTTPTTAPTSTAGAAP